jgi:murein L,D-transpeptidase YcbB/YkuD
MEQQLFSQATGVLTKLFNNINRIRLVILSGLIFLLSVQFCFADDMADYSRRVIKGRASSKSSAARVLCSEKLRCGSSLVAGFYQEHKFNPVWVANGKLTSSANILIDILNTAYVDGLNPNLYHVRQINLIRDTLKNLDEGESKDQIVKLLVNLDLMLTDGFFLYANNLSYGLNASQKFFPYWIYNKKPINFIAVLNDAIANDSLTLAVADLAPKYPMYAKLKAKLTEYQKVRDAGGWNEIPAGEVLKLGSTGDRVSLLQRRLLISGELDKIATDGKFDSATEKALLQYQQNNGLYDDGVVSDETLTALNVSASTRVRQIELNLDKIRFLPRDLGDEYIIVNLPAYSLDLVKDSKLLFAMDVAVGDVKHPSCILQSKISYLVLNPYWNIPASIALEEVWPKIKEDPEVFKKSKLQVLKNMGRDNYQEIDPSVIDWNKMSNKEFLRYRFRQAPGTDNALGKVKFMFQNSCDIYLHDSNKQEVFDLYRRDFSHGCIRIAEPMNLANYILGTQKGWSEDDVIDKLDSKQTKIVNLPKPINLYIVYFTTWVDENDWVNFRNDVYKLDNLSGYP